MTDEILLEAEGKMEGAVNAFERELSGVRTGRASTALVEHIMADAYGSKLPLIQLANLATPEAQLITITPFDRATVDPIIKALQQSDIGRIIRLPIPPLTEQRRKEMTKQVHTKTEEARVSVRNIRRHANDEVKKALKEGEISENESDSASQEVDRLTQQYIEKIEKMAKEKERELLSV
jgi:ribosome recycling factor